MMPSWTASALLAARTASAARSCYGYVGDAESCAPVTPPAGVCKSQLPAGALQFVLRCHSACSIQHQQIFWVNDVIIVIVIVFIAVIIFINIIIIIIVIIIIIEYITYNEYYNFK